VYKEKIKPRKKIKQEVVVGSTLPEQVELVPVPEAWGPTCGLTITYTPVTASTSSSHPAAEWSISSNFPQTDLLSLTPK
jgi:hypothetical protein